MSNNFSGKIDKQNIKNYLKQQVESSRNQEDGPKLHLENIKFYNTYSIYDKIFPFHVLFKTGEKIPRMDIEFLCTYRYLSYLRYEFVNLLNKKYQKYLTEQEKYKLIKIEEKYSMYNAILYFTSLILLFKRPIRFFKILNIYLAGYLMFAAKFYSIYLVRHELYPIKQNLISQKPLKIDENDVYDYTIIPDWKTYLYFYKIL
jgi:hypothetical protein